MAPDNTQRLLDRLDAEKRDFGSRQGATLTKYLSQLERKKITDAESLIRFHEILLFIRAYPPNAKVLRQVENLLASFAQRVEALGELDADLSPLDHPEVSGIAGTAVTDTFTYDIVRWLLRRHANQVAFDWHWFEDENRLAETWPRFMPLLEEDAFVEANVPYRKWLDAAKGRKARELPWLVQRFEQLALSKREQAELYNSQKLYVRWTPSFRASRTGMKLPVRTVFYHRQPLIQRRDISLVEELQAPPPAFRRLSAKQGQRLINMARETSTVRYRELYGFTHGDAERVLQASLGRGVELFVTGVPAMRRLPLRAYHAAMIFKNGVPVGYFEGLSLAERMESGFNFYYSFREGETAWIYARTLNVFRHLLGVTAFSIDPYQIGYENEEGIESGAFWFYRKLGFRPTDPTVLKVTLAEEKKLVARAGYRTPERVLRQLATGPMIFELDKAHRGAWDRFQVRNIGLAAQRCMAAEFKGQATKMRAESLEAVTRALRLRAGDLSEAEHTILNDLAVTLFLIPDLERWSLEEKRSIAGIVRAKAGTDEARYLKRMQSHKRLRGSIIELGSS